MNPTRHLRRLAAALTALAGAWLGLAVAAPAAFAIAVPPLPVREKHPPLPVHAHTVVGMPGWQIALIAIGAALAAAAVAVLVDRAWAAHRKTIAAAA